MRLGLIDGTNIFLRNYFTTGRRLGNGASFGFLKFLFKQELCDCDLAISCWDAGRSKRRKEIYPEYKANRKKNDEEWEKIQYQINFTKKFLDVLGVIELRIPGIEADDILASMCRYFLKIADNQEKKMKIDIFSSDKDFIQLLTDERVDLYDPNANMFWKREELPIDPENYLLYKCILGDSSDNIKGVKGYGDVKTRNMIKGDFYDLQEFIKLNKIIIDRNMELMDFKKIPKDIHTIVGKELFKQLRKRKASREEGREGNNGQWIGLCSKHQMNSLLKNDLRKIKYVNGLLDK